MYILVRICHRIELWMEQWILKDLHFVVGRISHGIHWLQTWQVDIYFAILVLYIIDFYEIFKYNIYCCDLFTTIYMYKVNTIYYFNFAVLFLNKYMYFSFTQRTIQPTNTFIRGGKIIQPNLPQSDFNLVL